VQSLLDFFSLTSPWELAAVALALAYLLLAVKRSLWCWPCALISSAIYVVLLAEARLYMQAALNVFYVGMAVYGFVEWRRSRDGRGDVAIAGWRLGTHIAVVASVLIISALNGWWLASNTDGALPYLDALVTWGSVVTTWMVARRVIENWLYWIVVDGIAAGVYFHQGLHPTGVLFLVYIGIVIRGYFVWLRESRASCTLPAGT
jgi:nicotinamide mononucleotide transporter